MVGTLFAGLFALGFSDLAYEVAMDARSLGMIVTQRNLIYLVRYLTQTDPQKAANVWELAVDQQCGRELSRLAFSLFKCYMDHGLIDKARSLCEDIKSKRVRTRMSPRLRRLIENTLEGKESWRKQASGPLDRVAKRMAWVSSAGGS
ncbi:unnamed protein product [Ostreobium quekettii]|uniref:Pentatricopeptide repeat-containing protein n=1 Tax=Ostreobium quekettii TaxID=121088 RepID=A0A8S1IUT1_9CHLO|nr:unnamed protein product [Ostreobium quekettii]